MHSDNEPMRKKIITILFAVFLFISSENASPTAFNIYKVKKGDTLYSISKKFQISLEILKKTNPKVTASGLKTGFLLKIPCNIVTQNGSEEFREIRFEPATTRRRNNTTINNTQTGDVMRIAHNKKMRAKNRRILTNYIGISSENLVSDNTHITSENYINSTGNGNNFIFPLNGKILSKFGLRKVSVRSNRTSFHKGIDIKGKIGEPILASDSGIISFSGKKRGFGLVVIIKHKNGFSTLYAHNAINLVRKNERVRQGQIIAKIGMTGTTTGSHVHFEIALNGKQKDPLKYLLNRIAYNR